MAKASIQLPNGTTVKIEGTTEEVKKLLEFYGGNSPDLEKLAKPNLTKRSGTTKAPAASKKKEDRGTKPDLSEIINLVKNCDEAEAIETKILDRISQVDRILLPLYIVHEHLNNAFSLTSGEISQITQNLGIPLQQPNISNALSGTASKYVIGDKVRKKGQAVRYKLSRRGLKYLAAVLRGSENGE